MPKLAKEVNVSVRVPVKLNRLIERKAVKDGIHKSEVIRIALIRYLVEEQNLGAELGDLQGDSPTERGTPPRQKGAK